MPETLSNDIGVAPDPETLGTVPSTTDGTGVRRILWTAGSLTAVAAGILIALNAAGIWSLAPAPKHAAQLQSLAVLPLENLSGDPAQEYFADGMTDELITDLAQIGGLRVISRTSAMQYKETKKSLPQIAKELNVDGVIEGTVERIGDRVRIVPNLLTLLQTNMCGRRVMNAL